MFTALQNEVAGRFNSAENFFKKAHSLEEDAKQISKGLAFVQIYAIYEYTVTSVVQIAIDALVSHSISLRELPPHLLSLFLDSQLQSLKDCSSKDVWRRRLEIFESTFSTAPAIVSNTTFPKDGSHFRHTQLHLIFDILGIRRTPAQRRRHLFRIDEVVEHRNAIAHGRETPDIIGRRYSRSEILQIMKQMKSVCTLLVSEISSHTLVAANHRRTI